MDHKELSIHLSSVWFLGEELSAVDPGKALGQNSTVKRRLRRANLRDWKIKEQRWSNVPNRITAIRLSSQVSTARSSQDVKKGFEFRIYENEI